MFMKRTKLRADQILKMCVPGVTVLTVLFLIYVLLRIFLPWLVWLSWFECHPIDQTVAGSIPGQCTCLGYRFYPQLGLIQEGGQSTVPCHINVSFSLSLSLHLSLPISPPTTSSLSESKEKTRIFFH